mmetsp:Transcript_5248/g.13825  ORF Transcript_5248/g.13825 Transcript_5248/m.13825 type:complete len:80 (-) Transcript_5248:985-1224(-)
MHALATHLPPPCCMSLCDEVLSPPSAALEESYGSNESRAQVDALKQCRPLCIFDHAPHAPMHCWTSMDAERSIRTVGHP